MPCVLRRLQDWHVLRCCPFGAGDSRHDCTPCGISGKDGGQWRAIGSSVPSMFAHIPCDCVTVPCSSMGWIAGARVVLSVPGCYIQTQDKV